MVLIEMIEITSVMTLSAPASGGMFPPVWNLTGHNRTALRLN